MIKKLTLLLLLTTVQLNAFSQDVSGDMMRDNGKINVVVAVAAIVVLVISAYMISIDRKVTRLEKKAGNK